VHSATCLLCCSQGRIVAQGNYEELVEEGIDFVSLMGTETGEEKEETRKERTTQLEKPILVNRQIRFSCYKN